MIYGIGVDLLQVERGQQMWRRFGDRAVRKMLHPEEHALLRTGRSPGAVLARSFAVKEAFVKALGTGFRRVGFSEVGAVRDDDGPPRLVFSARVQAMLANAGITGTHLSLSDEGGVICAFVVLERRDSPDSVNSRA